MAGMVDESMDVSGLKGEPWEFQSKPGWIKFLVILAGPAMNIVLAIFIAILLTLTMGISEPAEEARIGGLNDGFPAAAAGIIEGDLITEVNGQKIDLWEQLTEIIHAVPDELITVSWERNGEIHSAEIMTRRVKTPTSDGDIRELGMIGISPIFTQRPAGFIESIDSGLNMVYYWSRLLITTVRLIVTGEESVKSLGGPIMIGKLAGDSARAGLGALLGMMAMLSINLAVLNLLPIPVLDGGHLVFILIEGIIRKPLPTKAKLIVLQTGMAFILLLIAIILYNDVARLIN